MSPLGFSSSYFFFSLMFSFFFLLIEICVPAHVIPHFFSIFFVRVYVDARVFELGWSWVSGVSAVFCAKDGALLLFALPIILRSVVYDCVAALIVSVIQL